jgi:DNA-directed RNA polymerase specialized sigma24 family protein
MDINLILTNKYPQSKWILVGNDYEGLDWLDESPKPSEAQLESYWVEVQEAIQAKSNARKSALAKLAALGLTEAEIAAL